ncbi:hypothetical protein ANN_24814 [Periplaneta americana]|uniref:Mariner Mos1 transposase n=1 Tax=Periplaneta americana TaxID=6978 RepID=A0ABQ8RZN3_PERAM|nr:hypothetical protein ANN_24814 [Periplaneta americana]
MSAVEVDETSGALCLLNFSSINAQRYEETLQKLRRANKSKRPGMLSSGVILLHDNAHPHTANSVRNTIQRFGWETLQHPPLQPRSLPIRFSHFRRIEERHSWTSFCIGRRRVCLGKELVR